jgi:type IV pilus modification protein PilV
MSAQLRRRRAGLSLIEVMVAVLVLAIGLLGIAGLQAAALANNLAAYHYSQALNLAQALIERMRANRQGVLEGHYLLPADQLPPPLALDCGDGRARCSPAQQAHWDLAMVRARLAGDDADAGAGQSSSGPGVLLPGGRLSVTCEADCGAMDLRVVTIYWDAARSDATGTDCSGGRTQLHCLRLGYLP